MIRGLTDSAACLNQPFVFEVRTVAETRSVGGDVVTSGGLWIRIQSDADSTVGHGHWERL